MTRGRRGRRRSLISAALILATGAVLLALLVVPLREVPAAGGSPPLTGRRAPELSATGLDGRGWSLADAPGRLVWVNFWAASCPPCRTEMPAMQQLAEAYPDRLLVIGVNVGEEAATVRDFAERYAIGYPIVLDPAFENFYRWSPQYGLPRHYFVDAEGTVVREVAGELPPGEMLRLLEELLPDRGML